MRQRMSERKKMCIRDRYESISKLKHELSDTLTQINEASEQVASGSGQLAGGAQALAEGLSLIHI